MDNFDIANLAANVECKDNKKAINIAKQGDIIHLKGFEEYTIIDCAAFEDLELANDDFSNIENINAVTLQDKNGDIIVHYFGDTYGKWDQMTSAFGVEPQPSKMQKWAKDYFDNTIMNNHIDGNIFVSGYSQGGNYAQFVTIRSDNREKIDACISLSSPGFSNKFVKESNGLSDYQIQREKIFAYNGENDYVSVLGQEFIIPKDQIYSVKSLNEMNILNVSNNIETVLDNGTMIIVDDDTSVRKLCVAMNENFIQLPQEAQERGAILLMQLLEHVTNNNMESNKLEIKELFKIGSSAIINLLKQNSQIVVNALMEYSTGIPKNLDVYSLVNDCSKMSNNELLENLNIILDFTEYKNGHYEFNP